MSFSNLTKYIGPAPNELSHEELLRKLSAERDRVRKTIIWFREIKWAKKTKTPSAKKTGGKPASRPQTLMKNAGVTMDQLRRAAELLRQGKLEA